LPESISINNGSIDHQYTFGGEKIKKTGAEGDRYYIGGIEYNGTDVEFINIPNGRILKGEMYQYNLTDHLGNVVVMFEDVDGDGIIQLEEETNDDPDIIADEVLQRNHYYSFGMRVESPGLINNGDAKNNYLYNGKELNSDFGLDWSYYGFRMYDAAIGRFPSVDPIADQFAFVSPFNYAENEPIGGIDLHGLQRVGVNGMLTEIIVNGTFPHNSSRAAAAYRKQGLHADANKIMELHRNGMSLSSGISNQINNGGFPSIAGGISFPKGAGGGSADWQNGIGGNLSKGIGLAIGTPLLAGVAATTGTISLLTEGAAASGLFSIESSAIGFTADGVGQYGMSLINNEPFKYNFISGLSNGFLKNPFAANYIGAQFSLTTASTGGLDFKVNSFGNSLVAGSVGGVLGQFSGKFSGYLGDNFKLNWTDSYGQASSITNPIATGTNILTQAIHNIITSGAQETSKQADKNP